MYESEGKARSEDEKGKNRITSDWGKAKVRKKTQRCSKTQASISRNSIRKFVTTSGERGKREASGKQGKSLKPPQPGTMTNLCVYVGLLLSLLVAAGEAHLNLFLNVIEVQRLLGKFFHSHFFERGQRSFPVYVKKKKKNQFVPRVIERLSRRRSRYTPLFAICTRG